MIWRQSLSNGKTLPLPSPTGPASLSADVVNVGPPIPPIERIRLFSDRQWEEFVLEWADSLRQKYERVERCAGAGDMGRDVVATLINASNEWDNYQCKHYNRPLQSGDIWIELGKLIYYTHRKDYTYPRHYYFVAPQGAGTKLSNLLKNPERLRADLFAKWHDRCREQITSTGLVELAGDLKAYADSLDFSIFEAIPPLRIIDQHATTRWHIARFGGGLPQRPPIQQPPVNPADLEARYIRQLLDAYGDHLGRSITTIGDITTEKVLQSHYKDSRLEFYSAESLRTFSRDYLPPGEFEKLQDEVHSGIVDELRAPHSDGYSRLLAVIRIARILQITAHALVTRMSVRDRGGICHQLANDDKVRWTT